MAHTMMELIAAQKAGKCIEMYIGDGEWVGPVLQQPWAFSFTADQYRIVEDKPVESEQHVHHDLIVAWAKGAKIQYHDKSSNQWFPTFNPVWDVNHKYRIKPEPKPDYYRFGLLDLDTYTRTEWLTVRWRNHNLRATFDGETGKLKSIEII